MKNDCIYFSMRITYKNTANILVREFELFFIQKMTKHCCI